ncbi:hypothetical protein KGQ20_39495 [Catenulispora sp. NF23]|uniref:hypothetical protein n=1 Tax=Catenulispora pinistramenti TaxID=2705254 RepID=UPI001BAC135D|nr:hypothetical protein [Catenulispora pinistramenti]MBS2538849.1 hypothetical protein [Catenulispora pinistramenti]
MIDLAILAAVMIGVGVIAREARIYKRNKAFRATPVMLVGPSGPRWWQNLLGTLFAAAVFIAAGLAVLHMLPAPGTTTGPTTPLGGISVTTDPMTPAAVTHSPTSQTSTPSRGH